MPIYEYRCESCGFQKDHLQKLSDAALAQCPSCGSDRYIKQISAAGIVLKGNGWYATDFKGCNAPQDTPAGEAPSCGANCACHHAS